MSDDDDYVRVKCFNWSSETIAKEQYDEWLSVLTEVCSSKGVGQCVDVLFADYFIPSAPTRPPDNAIAEVQAEFDKLQAQYIIQYEKYQGTYLKAMGFLRKTLKYGTKARMEIEKIILTPPTVAPAAQGQPTIPPVKWTPDMAFKAAMKHLKDNYAPQDAFDATTIRDKLANLNDEDERNFTQYAETFTNLYCALDRAKRTPPPTDCVQWVKNGIRNEKVKYFLATTVFKKDIVDTLTHEEIFAQVRLFLKTLGNDLDPYSTVKSGPHAIPSMMVNKSNHGANNKNDNGPRCTRCWRTGHDYKKCNANTCSACGGSIADKAYCPAHRSHQDPPTRFVPKHLLDSPNVLERSHKKVRFDESSSTGSTKDGKESKEPKDPKVQAALHALRAAKKEYRKILKDK